MQRYFYKANPILRRVLEKQLDLVQQEESFFRAAMLALVRSTPASDKHSLYDKVMELTIKQQAQLAYADHLEQLFKHFSALHKHSRRIDILYEKSSFQQEGLVDPDKFPIWGTRSRYAKWLSGWNDVSRQLQQDIGFTLKIGDSSLQHIDAGKGVYIQGEKTVPLGTLLGFVPGKFYNPAKLYFEEAKKEKHTIKQYLKFSDEKILDMTRISIPPSEYELQGHFKNPYALGEYINHPPPRKQANVCFHPIQLPVGFFPSYLLRFVPYEYFSNFAKSPRTLIGIMALRDLSPGEELFTNYFEYHSIDIEDVPDWLLEPTPQSPFLTKNEYEHTPQFFWKIMEDYALRKNQEQYAKFKNTVRYEPDRYEFERGGKKYRQMTMVRFDGK